MKDRPFLVGWLLGAATVVVALVAVGLLFVTGIAYDTGADRPHPRIVAGVIHLTMLNSVARRAKRDAESPPLRDPADILAGAALYDRYCVACHGGPGVAREPWVSAMLPTPPYLLDARDRWSHAQLQRLVRNGVKMTGMPAWGELLSERQVSQVVAFVEILPDLKPDTFARVRQDVRVHPNPPPPRAD